MVRRVSVCVGGRVDEGVCGSAFTCVVLQVGVSDMRIWKLHSSHRYTVKSAYNHLTSSDVTIDDRCNHILCLKRKLENFLG